MRLSAERSIGYFAFLLVGIVVALTVRDGAYVAALADPSAYVSSAHRWLAADLFRPVQFHFLPGWPNFDDSGIPLGYRPGSVRGTDVVEYAPGFPIFMAAAIAVFGELGAYVTGAIFAALLGWSTYQIGARLSGAWAGLIAACLIVASPVTLQHTIHPMSDVPAAALWMLAWTMSLRSGVGAAAAVGAAVAGAVMVRPNLAPMGGVIALLVLIGGATASASWRHWKWRNAIVLIAVAVIGPAIVLWTQAVLYGHPLTPGYKGYDAFFRASHITPNLRLYPQWLIEVHGPSVFVGFALVPFVLARQSYWKERHRAMIVYSALGFILLNFALYLPYLNFAQWTYLRFVLPGMAALFILLAAVLVAAAGWLARRSRLLVPIALIPAALAVWQSVPLVRHSMNDWRVQARIRLMGRYLREALPGNAILLSSMHSGSLVHYTGRQIVFLDRVPPPLLDAVVERLAIRRSRPFFVLDDVLEANLFRGYFAGSQYRALDWPPRAEFASGSAIWLMDPADREPYRHGARWPIDILRWPGK